MSRRNSIVLIAVAFIAAAGAYWMLVLAPKREEAVKLNTKISTKQAALAQAEASLASYETARGSYRSNYTKIARLGKAVTADDDVRSLMVQLNSAADRSKVDFHTISLDGSSGTAPAGSGGPPDASGAASGAASALTPPPGSSVVGSVGFSTMPFSFKFNGRFSNLATFFKRLDRFVTVKNQALDVTGRLLLLNSISLQPDPVKGFPLITAEVKANSYLLPPTQDVLAAATAAGPTAAAGAAPGTPSDSTAPATTTTATVSGVTR
jgi:Tfp pilus assembly protein PilO